MEALLNDEAPGARVGEGGLSGKDGGGREAWQREEGGSGLGDIAKIDFGLSCLLVSGGPIPVGGGLLVCWFVGE